MTGISSWYSYFEGQAAAGPALRAALGPHWRGRRVIACLAGDNYRSASDNCVTVALTDFMRADRLIDLDSRSFSRLAPLSQGLQEVTISW